MGSKDKFYSMIGSDKGFDDVGIGQASGAISGYAAGSSKTGRSDWAGKLVVNIGTTAAAALLKPGQPIRLSNANSDAHTGLTRVLRVVGTHAIINLDFSTGPTGTTGKWYLDGGQSAWDTLQPLGAALTAANVTITFWDQNKQSGNPLVTDYEQGRIYVFPGRIKTIQIATAGNVRLGRAATLRPEGQDAV